MLEYLGYLLAQPSIQLIVSAFISFSLMIASIFILASGTRSFLKLVTEPIPVSHKIAVIGLPGAGKTTLITALFEMIQRGIHVDRVHLHGMETIKTVNKYIAALNSQEKIGPTQEKDIFVFRFSYVKRRHFLRRLYDVEIADFPGEYSQRISGESDTSSIKEGSTDRENLKLNFEYTLFTKEFFSWIGSSREYLFIVDLSSIYSVRNVRAAVADITARIRTSWQVIEDSVSERGIGSSQSRPVHLVFTKTDSVVPVYENDSSLLELRDDPGSDSNHATVPETKDLRVIKDLIKSSGATNNLIVKNLAKSEVLQAVFRDNSSVFSDLTSFFRSRGNRFNIIYSSMTIVDSESERLGVRKVLEACLP